MHGAPPPQPSETTPWPGRSAREHRPLVLVVTSDRTTGRWLGDCLADEHDVAAACDGDDGVDQALELGPDVVVADARPGGAGGSELIRALRSHAALAATPIVVLTAAGGDEVRARCLREGAQDWVTEPFAAEELRARVRNLLAAARARADAARSEERYRSLAEQRTEERMAELSNTVSARTEELERRKALMHAVVETAVDAVITTDAQGAIQSFNPAAEEMFGYAAAEVVGRGIALLMPSPDRERCGSYLAARVAGGPRKIPNTGREVAARRKDGSVFPARLMVSEVQLAGRRLFTGFLRDLTERKRLEAEYLQAQKMEAVGRLAGGVAHDFNNLLAGIQGGLGIAMKNLEPAHPALVMLRELSGEVERGASITRRLLDFSRTDPPATRPVDPRAAIRSAEPMIRRLLGGDVELEIECAPAGTKVVGAAPMIEQALLNLAINARDAMRHGGRLRIECRDVSVSAEDLRRLGSSARPGAWVMLSVEDTGCGMDQATLQRATEAFFTTKGPGMGTGLGLYTVDSMVRGWGGCLELQSTVGAGTRVRLYLPQAETAEAAETASAPEVGHPAEAAAGGETILVVEDEKLVRLGIQHLLEEQGYVVWAAKSADEALEHLRARGDEVDLLLTDVILPGMSGPELVRAARQTIAALPTVFMSAFPEQELVAQRRIQPGTLALEKPFTSEELRAKVRAALAGRRPSADTA